jgi:hypothetical protein
MNLAHVGFVRHFDAPGRVVLRLDSTIFLSSVMQSSHQVAIV